MRHCAEMQDAIFAKVLKEIKPGMRDVDVTAMAYRRRLDARLVARHLSRRLGADGQAVVPGRPAFPGPRRCKRATT